MSESEREKLRGLADMLVKQAKETISCAEELYRQAGDKDVGDYERAAMCISANFHLWEAER